MCHCDIKQMLIGKTSIQLRVAEDKLQVSTSELRVNKSKKEEKSFPAQSVQIRDILQENYILVTTFVVVMAHKTS